MHFLADRRDLSVAVVGFGYVGSCIGASLADRGVTVFGLDKNASLIAEMSAGRCPFHEAGLTDLIARLTGSPHFQLSSGYESVPDADVIIVTVGTPARPDGTLDSAHLEDVCRELAPRLRPGQLVILKSTVPPSTTRQLALPLLEGSGLRQGKDFGLAYCPERLAEGAALRQVRTLPIVVGGCCEESTAAAAAFWRQALGVETIPVATPETAEMVKLADNWWIDLNIAMANELATLCGMLDVDVLDVITAANSLPKGIGSVNILLPSLGVGGSCLTKDPWLAWTAARDRGVALRTVETARRVNDFMPFYTAELIQSELVKLGKDPATAKVAVLGLAYKNDTSDIRSTPALPLIRSLRGAGMDLAAFDPLVDAAEAAERLGVRPSESFDAAVHEASCVVFCTMHRVFGDVDFAHLAKAVDMPCLILDGRAYFRREVIGRLRALGFAYRGIGR